MVRPSEQRRPYFDAQPLKSGLVSVSAECIRLFSGEESPKSSREVAPILTVPFVCWIFGARQSAASFCLATASWPFTFVARALRSAMDFLALSLGLALCPPPEDPASALLALVFSSCLCLSRYCLFSRAALAFSAAVAGLSFSFADRSWLAFDLARVSFCLTIASFLSISACRLCRASSRDWIRA